MLMYIAMGLKGGQFGTMHGFSLQLVDIKIGIDIYLKVKHSFT